MWLNIVFALFLVLPARASSQWFNTEGLRNDLPKLADKHYVSLAFAGQDLVNAVSFFGHTFLVFHDHADIEPDAVVVEFVGQDVSGITEALWAGVSHIQGGFRLSHFLDKTREYQFQSRDIWFYRLNLSRNEQQKLVNNLISWHRKPNYPYNFFTTNCAYYIAALIESSFSQQETTRYVEGLNQSIRFKSPSHYVLPLDTVRDFQHRNRIGAISNIPATSRQAQTIFSKLHPEQQQQVLFILDTKQLDQPTSEIDPIVANTLALTAQHLIPLTDIQKDRNFFFRLLKLPLISPAPTTIKSLHNIVEETTDPTTQKESLVRLGVGQYQTKEQNEKGTRLSIEITPALRSFYHPISISTRTASLKILSSQWSFDHHNQTKSEQIRLDQFNFWQVETFLPANLWQKGLSQYFDASYYNWQGWKDKQFYTNNTASKELVIRLGLGYSKDIGTTTRVGLLVYGGGRYSHNGEQNRLDKDLGARWFLHQTLPFNWAKSAHTRLLLQQTYYYDSPFEFNRINDLGIVLFDNNTANISISNRWLGSSTHIGQTQLWQLGFTYCF